MIKLVPNASNKLNQLLNRKEFIALYISTKERAQNNHQTIFTQSLQSLITQIGIVISEIVYSPKLKTNTYLGSIEYISNQILRDKSVSRHLRATNINTSGNDLKHSVNSIDIDIETTLYHYNKMINKITDVIGLKTFLKFKIFLNKPKNIFGEKHNLKYENMFGHKITLNLSDSTSIDKFDKTIKCKLALNLTDFTKDLIKVTIYSQISNRVIYNTKLQFEKYKGYDLTFSVKEEELKNNYINIIVKLDVLRNSVVTKQKKVTFTTGIFFKKEDYYYQNYQENVLNSLGTKSIDMNIKLK